jgi:hypothetical protein
MNDIPPPSTSSSATDSLSDLPSSATANDTDADTSTDTSTTATPIRSNTPTGTVLVPGRDRSGTVLGRTVWDQPPPLPRNRVQRRQITPEDTSRPDTETEDDGDVDMDRTGARDTSPSPERRRHLSIQQRARRAVGIVSDGPDDAPLEVNADAHIIINDDQGGVIGGDGVGVEDGIVSLETNDDFAMGAPPGAPGAIPLDDGRDVRRGFGDDRRRTVAPDVTPRQLTRNLPGPTLGRAGTILAGTNNLGARTGRTRAGDNNDVNTTNGTNLSLDVRRTTSHSHNSHHHRDSDSGPYRDEDVLLSLQLLAYLSKYPHVRQAFYKPRATFHPASVNLPGRGGPGANNGIGAGAGPSKGLNMPTKESLGFFRAFGGARGKEKEKEKLPSSSSKAIHSTSTSTTSHIPTTTTTRHTNVFSLVERFTFRPSSTETGMPNPPPKLPPEIQYWAGVIMRNACRKDESRGGIRQCANSASFVALSDVHANHGISVMWEMGDLSSGICQMSPLSEGQILWKGLSEYSLE